MPNLNLRIVLITVLAVALVASGFVWVTGKEEMKTVSASFARAVSVYPGTEVRVLGVKVGSVESVTPAGDSVDVRMKYDAEVKLPADAQAVIITPTLVADRFVQLTPAYTEGPVMDDDASIALAETGVPVELDRIYRSLRDLTNTLGSKDVNGEGSLDKLLRAGQKSLNGNGELGNKTLRELSKAAQTFGNASGDLFATVDELAQFTTVLAENDKLVRAFITDLSEMSGALVSERDELEKVLDEVARAVGVVESFVRDNRKALVGNVERLTKTVKSVASEKEALADALRYGPVAIGNLGLAFNAETGSIGSRIRVEGNIMDADGLLCALVQQSGLPEVLRNTACTALSQLLEPLQGPLADGINKGGGFLSPSAATPKQQKQSAPTTDLAGLMGGAQ